MSGQKAAQKAGRRYTAPITVPVEPELDRFLEIYAAIEGISSKAELVRRAIYEYLCARGLAVKLGEGRYVLAPDAIERLARKLQETRASP